MNYREFWDLMEIIDAKIATEAAKDSSDGGLSEGLRERELRQDFIRTHVD